MYAIMEQAGHITSIRILELGLTELRLRRPEVEIHLIQPDHRPSPLIGPSMGFEASRAALQFGHSSVKEWLGTQDAAALRQRFQTAPSHGLAVRSLSLLGRVRKSE